MRVTAIGITSNSCPECSELKNLLQRDFLKYNIYLDFVEVIYDEDPKEAMKLSEEMGIKTTPSFLICDEIFPRYYDSYKITKIVNKIKNSST